jgi:adenylate kinase family enzyme
VPLARLGQACCVNRVVIFGRGGAGKSTLARCLAVGTQLPLIELDKEFWNDELEALPRERWAQRQHVLASSDQWIMDGDLGPYDAIEPRLRRADAVIILDLSLSRCAWRAVRRGRERRDFWTWTIRWRRDNRPHLLEAIAAHASEAEIIILRTPSEVRVWLEQAHG